MPTHFEPFLFSHTLKEPLAMPTSSCDTGTMHTTSTPHSTLHLTLYLSLLLKQSSPQIKVRVNTVAHTLLCMLVACFPLHQHASFAQQPHKLAPALALALDQDAEELDEAAIPDTKVAKHLSWVLRVVNSRQDPGDITLKFSPRFLEIYPAKSIVKELRTIRDDAFAGNHVIPVSITENKESISAIIVGKGTRRALSVLVVVDLKDDRIAGLYFDQAGNNWGDNAAGEWDAMQGNAGSMRGQAAFGAYEINLSKDSPTGFTLFPLHEFSTANELSIASAGALLVLAPLSETVAANVAPRLELPVQEVPAKPDPAQPAAAPPAVLTWETLVPRQESLCLLAGSVFDAAVPDEAVLRIDLPKAVIPRTITMFKLIQGVLTLNDAAAIDHAIALQTRESLERDYAIHAHDPSLMLPWLYRHEILRIRAALDPNLGPPIQQLAGQYARANVDDRRHLLKDEVAFITPTLTQIQSLASRTTPGSSNTPPNPGEHFATWSASTHDLAIALARIDRAAHAANMAPLLEALATYETKLPREEPVKPEAAPEAAPLWSRTIAFESREPGVIVSAMLLDRRDNRKFVLVVIQNHDSQGLNPKRVADLMAKGTTILGNFKLDQPVIAPAIAP